MEEWGDGAVECFCGRFLGGWISVSARLVSLSVVGERGGGRGVGGVIMEGCADEWVTDTGVHVLRRIAVEDFHDAAGGG